MTFRIKPIALRAGIAAAAIFIGCAAAPAQSVVVPPYTAKDLFEQAFDSPFGQTMIHEFNMRMIEGADRTCLRDRPRTQAEHKAQGEGFIRAWGLWAVEQFYKRVGDKAYNEALQDVLAPNALDKFHWLLSAPEVVRYREIERPVRYADVIYFVLELFDRYVVIEQLNMKHVSPLYSGDPRLLDASGAEKAQDALFEFQDANKTEALQRYVELTEKAMNALNEAGKSDEVSVTVLFKSADQDLGRLCILKKK